MTKINSQAQGAPAQEHAEMLPRTSESDVALCAAVLPAWVEQLRLAQTRSEKAVFDMLKAFSLLTQTDVPGQGSADRSDHENQPDGNRPLVNDDLVDRMYQGFQYQDGLNQLLELLIRDMQRMGELLASNSMTHGPVSVGPWIERLQSEFVMQEQRLAGTTTLSSAADSDKADDVTFF